MTPALRMALFYVLVFGGTGVSLPFAGLWFEARGLTGAEIGAILAVPMLARLVTGPMVALWADGFARRRTPLVVLGGVAAVFYAAAGLVEGFALWLPLWFVAATAAASMIPLGDVLTLRLARRGGFTFAGPRGLGSLAFIVANVAMGAMLTGLPADAIIVWVALAAALSAVVSGLLLPAEPVSEGPPANRADRFRGLGRLAADPTFLTAITAVGLINASHAFYYGFSAIAWKAQGISERDVGALWGLSVAAELVLMWLFEPWRRRRAIGPFALLAVGGLAAVARWAALAFAPPLALLWPLQTLHALSFAATFLAGLEIVERLSPPEHATAAQTLNSTLSSGVLIGLATVVSGPLWDAQGPLGYLAMAAMALAGAALALRVRRPVARAA